jgi:hypothetical protein
MRGWVKKWSWLCVVAGAAGVIIGWQERRCERQVERCRADYATRESRAFGFSVGGNAAEQYAINEACEPNSYLCRLFSAANLPTWLLVLVGFGGVGAAIKTLVAIERQTKAMVEGQRSRVAAKPHGDATQTLMDEQAPRVELELFNRGATEASGLAYETWIELLPDYSTDFTPRADHASKSEPTTLYPNHTPIIINIPIRKGLTEGERASLKRLRLFACIRMRVEYNDAFSHRWAEFGFYVTSSGLGFLPRYNDTGGQ